MHCCYSNTALFCLCVINLFAENSELSDFFGRFFTKWNPFDFNKFVSFIKKLFHQIHKRILFFPNFSFMTTIYKSFQLNRNLFEICCLYWGLHCVKNVHVRSYSGPYFPVFGLNIQSECKKIRTRITPNRDTFHAVLNWKAKNENINNLSIYIFKLHHNMNLMNFSLILLKSSSKLLENRRFDLFKMLFWKTINRGTYAFVGKGAE